MNIFVILVLNFLVYIFNVNFWYFYFLFVATLEAASLRRNFNARNSWIPPPKHTFRQQWHTRPPCSFISKPIAPCSRIFENSGPKFGHYRTAVSANDTPITDPNEELVNRIKTKSATLLDENISKAQFLERLASFGREIYSESPTPSIFETVPDRVDVLKKFNFGNLEGLGSNSRGYFVAQLPRADYKLLEDCSSSVYLSVHVDPGGAVYVDGISDSLIYKGLISLLIMHINGRKYEDIDFDTLRHAADLARVTDFGAVRNDAVNVILKHIKTECEKQLRPSPTSEHKQATRTKSRKRIAVLLSGGVDSSLTLWLLKNRGFDVEAFYLKVNDFSEGPGLCTSDDIKYASEVAHEVGVTLHVLPFSKAYRENILPEFFEHYRNGETPNPDVLCNSRIKFGEFMRRATEWGFTHVASGHYATLADDLVHPDDVSSEAEVEGLGTDRLGRYRVKRLCLAKDALKDQTYFLSRLTQAQLSRLIFPLGGFSKTEVRELARAAGLPSFNKKDSVGLCFLENLDFPTFLATKLGASRGNIVDYATNEVIGEHTGLFNYTIGQRRNVNQHIFREFRPCTIRHVVKKDASTNTLYVTDAYNTDEFMGPDGIRSTFKLADVFWNVPDHRKLLEKIRIGGKEGAQYRLRVKLRHSPKFHESTVNFNAAGEPTVHLASPDTGIATGQFCVFYLENYCIGSAKMVASEI